MKQKILLSLIITMLVLESAFAHDAWLSAKYDSTKSNILVCPLVGEVFPTGDAIKDRTRFSVRNVVLHGRKIPLVTDNPDSTVLGSVPVVSSCVVSASVKQREVTYSDTIALAYITEEIGLTKEEAAKFITPGVKEFSEAYSRHLKAIVTTGNNQPKDTAVGLPLELVLRSWKEVTKNNANVQVQLLENGKPAPDTPVRIVSKGKTTIVKTDSTGIIQATVDTSEPALFAYIQLKKINDTRLQSIWTNLIINRLQ